LLQAGALKGGLIVSNISSTGFAAACECIYTHRILCIYVRYICSRVAWYRGSIANLAGTYRAGLAGAGRNRAARS
jgi:hypothetical protein